MRSYRSHWIAPLWLAACGAAPAATPSSIGNTVSFSAAVSKKTDPVAVTASVSGTVIKILVQNHYFVHKGNVLVQLDPADDQGKVTQAEAELAAAQALADAADAQVQIAQATATNGSAVVGNAATQLASAQAAVAKANVELTKANLDLSRAQQLRAAGAIAQAQLDAAGAAQASAMAQLAAAQVMVAKGNLANSGVTPSALAVAQAQADVAHAHVRLVSAIKDAAEFQLSRDAILAPIDGVASDIAVHIGQLVQAGQTVVVITPPIRDRDDQN